MYRKKAIATAAFLCLVVAGIGMVYADQTRALGVRPAGIPVPHRATLTFNAKDMSQAKTFEVKNCRIKKVKRNEGTFTAVVTWKDTPASDGDWQDIYFNGKDTGLDLHLIPMGTVVPPELGRFHAPGTRVQGWRKIRADSALWLLRARGGKDKA